MILAASVVVTGFLTGRGIYLRSQPSWVDDGFGRFETGAKSATDSAIKDQEEAQLGADWTPTTWLHVHSRNRISARFDVFGTKDRDHSRIAETNTESGRAWTIAYFFNVRPSIRLGAEFTNIAAQRIAAAESRADPNTDGRTLTMEARYRFP